MTLNSMYKGAILAFLITVFAGCIFFSQTQTKASAKDNTVKYYKSIQIQDGETLWSIAKDNLPSDEDNLQAYFQEIKEINDIADENLIHEGNYLIVSYYAP